MKTKTFLFVAAAISTFNLQPSTLFAQGPLTPPGAPALAMKTLDQIDAKLEKRTPITFLSYFISEPGSYYVVSNLTAAGGPNDGIVIAANDVSLDLNGFTLDGGGTGGSGVHVGFGNHTNVLVRNGTIRGWAGDGVDAANTSNSRFENLRISNNGLIGINVGSGGTVSGCSVQGSSATGIATGDGCVVKDCVSKDNTGGSSDGIATANDCTVSGCAASHNGRYGINTLGGCTISGGTASTNNAGGIQADDGCLISHCNVERNGTTGIGCGGGNLVEHCTARNNAADGIATGDGSRVAGCTSSVNGLRGVSTGHHCTISGCTIDSNTGSGVTFGRYSAVIENNCVGNGNGGSTAGILTVFEYSRIEGNHLAVNVANGIKVNGPGNLIIKNSVTGANPASNYVVVATSFLGPTNNLIGGVITNQNPWANFSY